MNILLSNDDGYLAPGIIALKQALTGLADLTVVAPESNRSGASNSLTLERPLRVVQAASDTYYIDGTPTDCVHVAITGLMDNEPDMVVAGINNSSNLGDDTLYSGTVAAATEGRFLGLPAIAISLAGNKMQHLDTAGKVAQELVQRLMREPLPSDTILNVNVPDVPYAQVAGIQSTRLGHRHKSEPVIRELDPRGREIYWIGPAGPEQDAGEGTDFYAIKHNYVSVTPLQIDLTRHSHVDNIQHWLDQ